MPTCEERIDKHFRGAIEDILLVVQSLDKDFDLQELYQDYFEGVLCFQEPAWDVDNYSSYTHVIVQVQLSWGGPADGFIVEMDAELDIIRVCYYFQDWFDYAERFLSPNQMMSFSEVYSEILYDWVQENYDDLLEYMENLNDNDANKNDDDYYEEE